MTRLVRRDAAAVIAALLLIPGVDPAAAAATPAREAAGTPRPAPASGGDWVVVTEAGSAAGNDADEPDLRSPSRVPVVERAPPAPVPAPGKATAQAEPDGRSYGGAPVTPGSAVWQAEIYRVISDERWAAHLKSHPDETRPKWQLQHWCGAALIAEDWVLTAAHCVLVDDQESAPLMKPGFGERRAALAVSRERQISLTRCVQADQVLSGFRVRLGANDVSVDDGINLRIDCAVVHPGWKPSDIYHDDIALVHMIADGAPPVRDPARVREIRLHRGAAPAEGASVTVTGWGKTKNVPGFAPSAVLMQVALNVQSAQACASRLAVGAEQLTSNVLCAGAPARKTCLGDSGGPVVFTGGRPNYLVGVVSWGIVDCAGDAMPGVYTRVGAYTDWIDDVLTADR